MITKEQYREHMNHYAHETSHMSFTITAHPDYKAMLAMGEDIIPYLLEDIQAHPKYFMGDEYWSDFWASIHLLYEILQDKAPIIPEEDRGSLDPIQKLWVDWGIQNGYLTTEIKTKPWYAWKSKE
jgi:hypothetical protein